MEEWSKLGDQDLWDDLVNYVTQAYGFEVFEVGGVLCFWYEDNQRVVNFLRHASTLKEGCESLGDGIPNNRPVLFVEDCREPIRT